MAKASQKCVGGVRGLPQGGNVCGLRGQQHRQGRLRRRGVFVRVRRAQGRFEVELHDEARRSMSLESVGVQEVGDRLDPGLEGQDGAGAGAGDAHLEVRAGLLPEAKSGEDATGVRWSGEV